MDHFAIRCRPAAPAPADELERWLGRHVDELRAAAPNATLRLSRLTQDEPSTDLDVGWLVELDLADDEPLIDGQMLADLVRDMRLLGLQPKLLTPHEPSTNGKPA